MRVSGFDYLPGDELRELNRIAERWAELDKLITWNYEEYADDGTGPYFYVRVTKTDDYVIIGSDDENGIVLNKDGTWRAK
jgi:hypothetical protein